ncbi:MAG TPA: glycoside hydrolase family 16 protein [Burkholderiaceae bacterium]|nr:glycoside hydrolase family 16 protein [Burkholderiaceae bacterium]
MYTPPRARVALSFVVVLALAGTLSLSGCGGGGSADGTASADAATADAADSAASTQTATTADSVPTQQAQAYTVLPDELVTNGLFSNGLTGWTVGDAVLVNSTLRSGGKALDVGWRAIQTLSATALSPRKSYTLTVKARNVKATGNTEIAFHFRRPGGSSEAFRTFKTTVTSTTYQDYQVTFTAPEYVGMPDITITASGSRTIVDSVSLKMRSAVDQTEPIASTEGSYVPAGYVLAFNDEFNGTALNRDKWFTRLVYGGGTQDHLNNEQQRYRDNDNHRVANGVLSLVARKVANNANGINYESGMIRSDWTARYGYYEARVKMPGGVGVWPAFWLNSDVSSTGRLAWPPEIDIFEFVNNGVEDTLNMLHSNVKLSAGQTAPLTYADPAFNTTWSAYIAPYNFNEGWHTVGVEWTVDRVSMFIDGQKIYSRSYAWNYGDGTLGGPAHILLNFAVGGAWAGRHGIDDSAFPQAFQIDWVRAYQKAN